MNDGTYMHLCTFMAGAEMEKLFFGFHHGGAEDDAWQITLMLDDIDGDEALAPTSAEIQLGMATPRGGWTRALARFMEFPLAARRRVGRNA